MCSTCLSDCMPFEAGCGRPGQCAPVCDNCILHCCFCNRAACTAHSLHCMSCRKSVVCDSCKNIAEYFCDTCGQLRCTDCRFVCSEPSDQCKRRLCVVPVKGVKCYCECSDCGLILCWQHALYDDSIDKPDFFCPTHLPRCTDCKSALFQQDTTCSDCGKLFCDACLQDCANCENPFCPRCLQECELCERNCCNICIEWDYDTGSRGILRCLDCKFSQ